MSSTEIEILFEGTTEENVLSEFSNEVIKKGMLIVQSGKIFNHRLRLTNAGGKSKIPGALESALILLSTTPDVTKRILVLLDLDDIAVCTWMRPVKTLLGLWILSEICEIGRTQMQTAICT